LEDRAAMTGETANLTINGLSHGGVTVTDMERSLRFYRDGLGLEVYIDRIANHDYLREVTAVPSTEVRIVYLRVPGSRVPIELLEHRGIERVPSRARPCDPGSVHLGLQVEDIDAFHDRLVSLGFPSRSGHPVDITAGPFDGARTCFFHDPDGFLIELQQPPAGKPDAFLS
jgi:catechol 2,3-dioxygenase-like lactoylglutathione lyase family enzyme